MKTIFEKLEQYSLEEIVDSTREFREFAKVVAQSTNKHFSLFGLNQRKQAAHQFYGLFFEASKNKPKKENNFKQVEILTTSLKLQR